MVSKSKAAGGFLGGFTNNLGVVGIAIALGGLLIFRDKISNFFQSGFDSIGSGLGDINVNLPAINLPAINFPDFNFPDITNIFGDDSSSIAGETVPSGDDGTTVFIPADTTVNPDGTVSSDTPPLLNLDDESRAEALAALEAGRARSAAENALAAIPESEDISGAEFASARNVDEFQKRLDTDFGGELLPDLPAGFEGGGVSFIGGSIFETQPSSLSDFVDQGLTASQAANALAIQNDDFGDFDFGTNTGSGLSPINDQIITGGATLESEGQRAACLSCRLFGLNCPLCNGTL